MASLHWLIGPIGFSSYDNGFILRAHQIADGLRDVARKSAKVAEDGGLELAQLQLVNRSTELKLGTWRLSATYDFTSDAVSFSRPMRDG